MLRIVRSFDGNTTTLAVSGRIDAEQLSELRRLIDETERANEVVIDLSEVNLVALEVVGFFVHCEMRGIRLTNCPAYVREWMAREKRPRD